MKIVDELERLAKLRREGALSEAEFAKAKNALLLERQGLMPMYRGVRRQSERKFCGLPLWSIALGPDWEKGEMRGHAKGIIAVGDMATGWLALGGFAKGFVAVGGAAVGLVALGGCAVGILLAIGGLAIGGIAIGGGAFGAIAIGGGAVGYYAFGGGAAGVHPFAPLHAVTDKTWVGRVTWHRLRVVLPPGPRNLSAILALLF